jgi:hypothetical protein
LLSILEETENKLSAVRLENARLIDNNNLSFITKQENGENIDASKNFFRLSFHPGKSSISRKTYMKNDLGSNLKNELPTNVRFSSIFKPRISALNNYRKSNVMESAENGNGSFVSFKKSTIFDKNFQAIKEEGNHAR